MTRDEPWRRFTPFDHPPPRGITHDLSPPYCSKKARVSERMSAPLSFFKIIVTGYIQKLDRNRLQCAATQLSINDHINIVIGACLKQIRCLDSEFQGRSFQVSGIRLIRLFVFFLLYILLEWDSSLSPSMMTGGTCHDIDRLPPC